MKKRKILWIDLQPSLYCLFKRTAQSLGQRYDVKRWSFEHDPDESCDIDIVHALLKQTIEKTIVPIHLVGHGISGTIAYLYAKNIQRTSPRYHYYQSTAIQTINGPHITRACEANYHALDITF